LFTVAGHKTGSRYGRFVHAGPFSSWQASVFFHLLRLASRDSFLRIALGDSPTAPPCPPRPERPWLCRRACFIKIRPESRHFRPK
jgi:hypothetical protein